MYRYKCWHPLGASMIEESLCVRDVCSPISRVDKTLNGLIVHVQI